MRSDTIRLADSVLSISQTNRRMHAENMTHILVAIRNISFGMGIRKSRGKGKSTVTNITDGSIPTAVALGSNVSRRAMEFITHL